MSSLQEAEARTITVEWVQAALRTLGLDIPVDIVGRRLRALPQIQAWAISEDALSLSLLGVDDTLYTLAVTDHGDVLSTLERRLRGEPISVHREEGPAERYRDTETARENRWSFAYMNGEQLIALTGCVFTDRNTGGQRRDNPERLAEAIAELSERSASR